METITQRRHSQIKANAEHLNNEPRADLCLACGTCSAGCPITGSRGFDPRKIVRMVLMGRDAELIESKLPWLCTLCGKCEYACPMGINIAQLVRTARGMVDREKVPGMIQKGIELANQLLAINPNDMQAKVRREHFKKMMPADKDSNQN